MNRNHIIRDALSRLIETIHYAEDIDEDGGATYDYGEIASAVREAERVLAREEER